MYKGTYNEKGEYTGFYVEGIHENIPKPNISLTEEQWQQALSKNYSVANGLHTEIPFVKSQEEVLENIRKTRNNLLTECDWTQLEDAPLSNEKKAEWKSYRQILRDLTITEDLSGLEWPEKPL